MGVRSRPVIEVRACVAASSPVRVVRVVVRVVRVTITLGQEKSRAG